MPMENEHAVILDGSVSMSDSLIQPTVSRSTPVQVSDSITSRPTSISPAGRPNSSELLGRSADYILTIDNTNHRIPSSSLPNSDLSPPSNHFDSSEGWIRSEEGNGNGVIALRTNLNKSTQNLPIDNFDHINNSGIELFPAGVMANPATDSFAESDGPSKPKYGRLESAQPSRENTDSRQLIAEFAKGHKSMATVARYDVKNRWLVSFSWAIFIEMFIIHAFGPFAVPYCVYRYSWNFVTNTALLDFKLPRGVGTYFWLMWVSMNFLYWLLPTPHIPFSEVFIASCIFLARNCIIAAKYGYGSPGFLSDMSKRVFTREELASFLIVSGWHAPTVNTIRTELDYALKRTHVDLKHMYFHFLGDDREEQIAIAKKLHASFDETMVCTNRCPAWEDVWLQKIEQGELPGRILIMSLLQEAVSSHAVKPYTKIAILLGGIHSFIPTIMRACGDEPKALFGDSPQEALIIVFAILVSWFNTMANIMFVLVGVIDYDRRVYLMHQCSAMVTATYKIWQTGKSQLMPLLNFEKSVNIANWLDMRLVMKDWGLNYFMRIQSYASLWLFFILIFFAYLVSQIITRTSEMTSIVLISYDLAVVMVSLIIMIQSAKTLNRQHMEHRRILLHKLSQLQKQISRAVTVSPLGLPLDQSKEKLSELIAAKDMLMVAIEVMAHEDEVAPVQILGFDANDNFLRGLLGVAGSAVFAALKVILGF